MSIYRVTVTRIGAMAGEFMAQGMIVLFDENAPPELAEISILHSKGTVEGSIRPGHFFSINDSVYRVTAVGYKVEENLSKLGHITVKFDGKTSPELPGDLHVEAKDVPAINPGDVIEIKE